jgi:hypothetical protein
MNNRVQQRFDQSIREAVTETEQAPRPERSEAQKIRTRRRAEASTEAHAAVTRKKPTGRLYLDPETGATVYDPHWTEPA